MVNIKLSTETAANPVEELEALADAALEADLAAKEAAEKAKALKDTLKDKLQQYNMLSGDTKALGHVRTVIKPVRRFDEKLALDVLSPEEIEANSVRKLDPALLKRNFAPAAFELFQRDYGFSVELKIAD